MNQPDFKKQLEYGKYAEEITAKLLKKLGWFVIPKYLYVAEDSPCLFGEKDKYCVPDIDVACNGMRVWIESKRKQTRKYYPDTGFSKRLLDNYLKTQEITGTKVFVLFWDEKEHKVYGNWLDELLKPVKIKLRNKTIEYPLVEARNNNHSDVIIYFAYPQSFIVISTITEQFNIDEMGKEGLKSILTNSQRNTQLRFGEDKLDMVFTEIPDSF